MRTLTKTSPRKASTSAAPSPAATAGGSLRIGARRQPVEQLADDPEAFIDLVHAHQQARIDVARWSAS